MTPEERMDLQKQLDQKQYEVDAAKKSEQEEVKRKREAIDAAVDCLRAVRIMLEVTQHGATHRQRNFYNEAIIAFINQSIIRMDAEKDPFPF